MGQILLRPLALKDVRETCGYLKENAGPNVADRYLSGVRLAAEQLLAFPHLGSPCLYERLELKHLRRWPVKDFPRWMIFYFPSERGVEIARVLHCARDLNEIFKEE